MTKEQQNLTWQCLPKEVRKEMRKYYPSDGSEYEDGYQEALEYFFGSHNLTSDTEPPELLFVERKKVVEKCNEVTKNYAETGDKWCSGYISSLNDFFGNKCLPDKELNEDNFAKPETSVQGEPRFKVGEKVLCKVHEMDIESLCIVSSYNPRAKEYKLLTGNSNIVYMKEECLKPYIDKQKFKVDDEVIVIYGNHKGFNGIIKEYSEDDGTWAVILNGYNYPINFAEEWIEPYTEPKFKVGDKVRVKGDTKVREVYRVLPDGKVMFGDKGSTHLAINLELVEPETKDNMEEKELGKEDNFTTKELNLVELLKGCDGEEFYYLGLGNVVLEEIQYSYDKPYQFKFTRHGYSNTYFLNIHGNFHSGDNTIILFPSRALYEKYPLDAYSAWMEWKLERTPKRWTPKIGERIFWVNSHGTVSQDVCRSDIEGNGHQLKRRAVGNEFKTGKEAQQAAEAVRECLIKFQEQNMK